jgi:hypothetical protein
VIVNGSSNRCVWWWTQHLEAENNDSVRIGQSRGLRSESVYDMLCEMQSLAAGTDCKNFFYQMNLNPSPGEHLTREQWDHVREKAEKTHGLEGQPFFEVWHVKYGREHPHYIYLRVNLETGNTISDSYDARKNHALAREIEREFGLQKVVGPYDREPGTPRPERAPKRWEMYRAMQSGIDIADITAEITELHQQSENAREFRAAIESHGYILARGDKKTGGELTLMIIDPAGDEHSLVRRLKGVTTKQLNDFMRDVDREALPDIRQAQAIQQERKIAALEAECDRYNQAWENAVMNAAIEKEKIEGRFIAPEDREQPQPRREKQPNWNRDHANQTWESAVINAAIEQEKVERQFVAPAEPARQETRAGAQTATPKPRSGDKRIRQAEHAAMQDERTNDGATQPDAKAFAEELERHGLAFARVTADEAYRSEREAEFTKAIERTSPVYREGEIVAVTEPGLQHHSDGEWKNPPRVHKLDPANAEKYLALLSIDKNQLPGIDAIKAMLDARAEQRAADWQAIRHERATTLNDHAPQRSGRPLKPPKIMTAAPMLAVGAIGKTLDIVGGIFESIFAPQLTRQQIREGERAAAQREAEAERAADFASHMAQLAQERQNRDTEQAARDRQRESERQRF